jgi:hypothetical protein
METKMTASAVWSSGRRWPLVLCADDVIEWRRVEWQLLVNLGISSAKQQCPVHPRFRTSERHENSGAMCQKLPYAPQQTA